VNPSDPEQSSDSVEIDASRGAPSRIAVNFFMRSGVRKAFNRSPQAVSISVAEATQQVPRQAKKALETANKYRSKNQHEQALASFDRAIEFFPDYFQALAGRGHLRLAMGQVSAAAQDFARALELNARCEPALRGSGLCKFQQGSFEDAAEDFERAAAEAPGNPMNHLLLGIANSALGRHAAAHASLGKALSLDPVGAVRAHVHLANLWIKQDRPREAIAELEAYLAAAPNAPDAEKWRILAGQLRRKALGK
jgi:tetratricopeptide (TPR) repeat protein